MSKKSSYQKLKDENERLKNDIYTLTVKSDTPEGVSLKMRYVMRSDIDKMCFLGNSEYDISSSEFKGFFNKLNEQ
jgi:NADPH-dependent 7-cyano-7-deazaguanine reductase QueF